MKKLAISISVAALLGTGMLMAGSSSGSVILTDKKTHTQSAVVSAMSSVEANLYVYVPAQRSIAAA